MVTMTGSLGYVDAGCPIRETIAWRGPQADTDPPSPAAFQDLVSMAVVVAAGSFALPVPLLIEVSETPEAQLLGMLGAVSAFAALAAALLSTGLGVAVFLLVLPIAPALGLAGAPR